jgi:hypothetical protein
MSVFLVIRRNNLNFLARSFAAIIFDGQLSGNDRTNPLKEAKGPD